MITAASRTFHPARHHRSYMHRLSIKVRRAKRVNGRFFAFTMDA
jgi:hypothetical protein